MNEMVERVARALVDQLRADRERMRAHESLNYEQTDLWPDEDHMPPPNNGVYDGMIDAVALARAALAAIRVPNQAMVDAVEQRAKEVGARLEMSPESVLEEMIDAALAE